MSIFDLQEADKARAVAFNIPPKLDPYFQSHYQRFKKENEAFNDFLLRVLSSGIIDIYAQTKIGNDKKIFDDNVKIAANDLSTFKIENGLNE